ncbi:unnamed protein product [Ophioblennius macclurei]
MIFSVLFVLAICLMPTDSLPPPVRGFISPLLQQCFEDAKKIVDDAYAYSRQESLRRVRKEIVSPHNAGHFLEQLQYGPPSTARSADYMAQTLHLLQKRRPRIHKRSLNATDMLSKEDLMKLSEITGCAAQISEPECNSIPDINKFRTITGVCNNLQSPRKGASNIALRRWLHSEYDDGISEPKGSSGRKVNNFPLPLVRQVSNNILSQMGTEMESDSEITDMLTVFSKWLERDLSLTPFSPSINSFNNQVDCEGTEPCTPTPIPQGDRHLSQIRSASVCGTGILASNFSGTSQTREQINTLTSFLDASNVYGSEEKLARDLRNLSDDGGLLKVNQEFTDHGRELLPFSSLQDDMCATGMRITNDTNINTSEIPCFFAGDNENVALTTLHTLFVREHNRLARELRRLNPHWSSETLYQEARKIMGAYAQMITFRDYLPHILGDDQMRRIIGPYNGYNSSVDPSITNVFATAAFHFAHLGVQPPVSHLDANYTEDTRIGNVSDAFYDPWKDFFRGGIDPLLHGLISRAANGQRSNQEMDSDARREKLLEAVQDHTLDIGSVNNRRARNLASVQDHALDIGSVNSQKGRNLGLPGGNDPVVDHNTNQQRSSQEMDSDARREKLLKFGNMIALDLGSLNTQRGRDHGLPGYNVWRKFCGLSQPRNQSELALVLGNVSLARSLLQHYGTPDNIDVWVGGVAEPFVTGGRVGPLFACLIGRQFKNLRDGDRLWYENENVFSPSQRAALSSVTLGQIICDNSAITSVSMDVFTVPSSQNQLVQCSTQRRLDLNAWKETPARGWKQMR